MQHKAPETGKPSSNILPGVVAAFLGAALAVACDRPDPRPDSAASVARDAPQGVPSAPRETPAAGAPPSAAAKPGVAMPSKDATTDNVITGRIKSALQTDPGMAGADVSVNTDRGVVSLAGTVKSHEQTGIASAHAQRQDGVVRVDNHLAMNPQ